VVAAAGAETVEEALMTVAEAAVGEDAAGAAATSEAERARARKRRDADRRAMLEWDREDDEAKRLNKVKLLYLGGGEFPE
jgi:hypothetical protein